MGRKMARVLIAIILLSLAAVVAAQAGELRIIETEEGITAEYTGTPAETGGDGEKPAEGSKPSAPGNSADEMRQPTDRDQAKIADRPKPNEELPVKPKSYRQERKKQTKALRESRTPSPAAADPEQQ
jgi:hypothetical protein